MVLHPGHLPETPQLDKGGQTLYKEIRESESTLTPKPASVPHYEEVILAGGSSKSNDSNIHTELCSAYAIRN